jgi:hypothetical protein
MNPRQFFRQLSLGFSKDRGFCPSFIIEISTTTQVSGFVLFFCDTQKFSITLFRIFFFSRTWWWRMNGKKSEFKIVSSCYFASILGRSSATK